MREMKDSGIEWIGDIPYNWKTTKIKYIYNLRVGFTPDTTQNNYYNKNEGYTWVTIADLNDKGYTVNSQINISEEFIKMRKPSIVLKGSLLYSFKLSVGKVSFAGKNLYTNEAIASFETLDTNCLHYLYYASFLIKYNSNINIYGAKILNQQLINNSITICPPLKEQQRISDFLDKKIYTIDNILSGLNKQIDILNQYKQSLITETVTKGLNPNVEMKDSGIEWIGKIPKEWKVIKFKYLHDGANVGESINNNYLSNNKRDKIFYTAGLSYTYTIYDKFPKWKLTQQNDLLLSRNGTPYVYRPIRNMQYSDHIIRAKISNNNNSSFIYYCLQLSIKTEKVEAVSLATWSISLWNKQNIPYPPMSEQQQIVDYLDSKCSKIDSIIEQKKKEIETIEQYKKSLIYEYVTGKKEVSVNE